MNRYATLAAFVPLVAAHGFIRTPAPRQPGDAYKAACGDQPFYQQSSDINGNVQGILQVVGNDLKAADCNLWLCKGFQFDDNKANVHSFSLGEKIDFDVNIAAPHTGIANVSVVKTSSNSIIGAPLIEFTNYAANSGVAANNSAFSVTLPDNLDGDCTTAGDCVLQWYWDAADINQTYESCVDFTVSGSGSGPSEPETPASSAAPAPASSSASEAAASTPAASAPVSATDAAPAPTSATEVVTSAISPKPTSTPAPEDPAEGDDDECPADDDDEEGDDEDEGDDDECPADEDDDEDSQPIENPAEGDDEDDECPADEDEGDEDEGDDDECPADEEDEGDYPVEGNNSAPASAPTAATLTNKVVEPTNKPQPPKESNKPSNPQPTNKPSGPRTTFSTIIREVTVTKEAPTVTVTAPASAECTTA